MRSHLSSIDEKFITYCAGHNYTTETQIKTIFFCGTVPKTGFLGKKKIILTVLKQKPSK